MLLSDFVKELQKYDQKSNVLVNFTELYYIDFIDYGQGLINPEIDPSENYKVLHINNIKGSDNDKIPTL